MTAVTPADAPAKFVHRLVDRKAFTRAQVILFLPNVVMLCAFVFCHLYRFQAAHLLHPATIAMTNNYLLTGLAGMYAYGVQWPLLAALLHSSSAAMQANSADIKASSNIGEQAARHSPYETALHNVKLIGPEWVQTLLWIISHLLVAPFTWWNIMVSFTVGPAHLQLCRSVAIGTIRREFDNGVSQYVRSFINRFIPGLLFCMFLFSYGLMTAFSYTALVSNAQGGQLAEVDFSVLPEVSFCAQNINESYVAQFCTNAQPIIGWWQPYMRRETCNDGGWADIYRSLYDACEGRFVYDGVAEAVLYGIIASVSSYGVLLGYEVILGIEPDLAHATLANLHKVAGSRILLAAIGSYALVVVCIPLEISRMLSAQPGSSSEARTSNTLGSVLSGKQLGTFWVTFLAMPLCMTLVLLMIVFLWRRYSPKKVRRQFLSYKQNDGNDGAMEMLYHTLPGQTWLDKHAKDRSTDGMTAGVVESNIFIAVLSPAYFDSVYCCLEMYTAMSLRKPILCSFNLSKHKISEALAMIPPELDALKKVEVQPVHEDTEWMEMCVNKITGLDIKPYQGGEPPLKLERHPAWAKGVSMYQERVQKASNAGERCAEPSEPERQVLLHQPAASELTAAEVEA